MNKITWMITIPLMSRISKKLCCTCPVCPREKSRQKEANLGENTNGSAVTEVTQNASDTVQVNSWGDEDQHLMMGTTTTCAPASLRLLPNESAMYQPTVDRNPQSTGTNFVSTVPESTLNEVPLMKSSNPAYDWPVASSSEVIGINVKSGVSHSAPLNMHDQDKLLQKVSDDIPPRFTPIRAAPAPPVKKTLQHAQEILSPARFLTSSEANPSIPQRPEPIVPPRPEFNMPTNFQGSPPRFEPVIPRRPETVTPVVPNRPQTIMPLRPEFPVLLRNEPLIPPKPGISG